MLKLDINEIVGFQVESTAEWRRLKAEQFPDDARNLEAADELDRLASEIGDLEGSDLHLSINALIDRVGDVKSDLSVTHAEMVSDALRAIGFHGSYENGAAFLEWYRDSLEELLRDHINDDDDDGIPAPDLAELVENDPVVKAAKQRYEEARAKAYAEAVKLL
jgi:hypothetical protein